MTGADQASPPEGSSPGNNSRIQAVMFDFGGVLYHMPNPRRMERLLRFFGVRDPGPITMAIASPLESPLVMDLMTGRLAEHELWSHLAATLGIRPALLSFLRKSGFSPRRLDRQLSAYLTRLRPRCRTAILTNAGSDFRATFGQVYALESMVDQLIISAEEGIAKPDPQLYKLALERLGVDAHRTLFVDDIPENVSAAKEIGLNALLHQTSAHTITWVEEVLGHG